jgi:flagellar hook-length control protein FliK
VAAAKLSDVGKNKSERLEAALKDMSVSDPTAPGFVLPEQGKLGTLAASNSSAAVAGTMMPQTEGAVRENAQEVIRNAQLLLQKGGGEMKMQLKPEGVGEVLLKVQVKDGQVAVQMLTESDSAKKLLETGLEDLKTSLAANKLHVDALKIEVGTEMAKQRFEQSQQDASREQARQFAQDFMGQFRQDREAFRQGFADGSGLRSYGAQRRSAPPEMEAVTTQSQNKSTSSRRLDLVA